MRSLILFVTVLVASITAGCRASIPRWDGKLYAGDSANSGISRKQSGEIIRCDAPEVDTFICMSGDDFKSFYETYILGCRQWSRGMPRMSVSQAWAILDAAYQNQDLSLTHKNNNFGAEVSPGLTDDSQGFE